jgi:coproporphyrinogen III oxidase-like Fe-S oxidoreductase
MVGSYHNHAEHGHTRQLIKTLQHGGGTRVLLMIEQIERAHQTLFHLQQTHSKQNLKAIN